VVPRRPGVRLVDGVLYYSSAWLDSTRPVMLQPMPAPTHE
jgi:hypothetical protein